MRSILALTIILFSGTAAELFGQEKTRQKPYILELSGGCYPHEMSIEYFIAGAFGGYGGFVKTDSRFFRYEIPAVRDGKPAKSMKIIVRSARCRTATIDIPEIDESGRLVRARLRRSRGIEFRGRIVSPEVLSEKDVRVTAVYWANWKCEFIGVVDCLIGPNHIDSVDVKPDGSFKVRLPDVANDPALFGFANKGTFQVLIRERETGNILYNLRLANSSSRSIGIAADYPGEAEFVAEPVRDTNTSIPERSKLF